MQPCFPNTDALYWLIRLKGRRKTRKMACICFYFHLTDLFIVVANGRHVSRWIRIQMPPFKKGLNVFISIPIQIEMHQNVCKIAYQQLEINFLMKKKTKWGTHSMLHLCIVYSVLVFIWFHFWQQQQHFLGTKYSISACVLALVSR